MKYPDYFPQQALFDPYSEGMKGFRYAWEEPMQNNSAELAHVLIHAAKEIEHEGGLCHLSFAVREAAMRIEETMRILKNDKPSYEQLNEIQKIHNGQNQ